MPKKQFPYNQKGRLGTYPWLWAWDVPTSKGTGTPYVVSVRDVNGAPEWGCNCMAGKNGHPTCQHRMRVQYDLATVPYMINQLSRPVRDVVAPHAIVSSYAGREEEIPATEGRRIKVVV